MSFYINFTIPSTKTSVRLKEITFKDYKLINKFLVNKNNTHINECFDRILEKSIIESDNFSSFNNYDKFCALFLLRVTSISPDIEFKDKGMTFKKSLTPFLSECLDFSTTFSKKIYCNKLEIKISLPSSLYFDTIFDAYSNSISKIYLNNKQITISPEIINELPAEVNKHIKDFSSTVENSFSSLVFDVLSNNPDDPLRLSPFNLSLFEILKALYTSDLKNLFELHYILVSKLHYAANYIDENTLTENLILFNIYEQEIEKMNEEQKKIDKQDPVIK